MLLFGFTEHGTDDALVKALDKTKLVQKDVQYKTKTGIKTRKQWVKSGEDQPTQKVSKQDDQPKDKKPKTDQPEFPWDGTDDPKKAIMSFLASGQKKEKLMEDAHNKGITWTRCYTNANIDWMRCSMAIQKHLKENSVKPKPADQSETTPAGAETNVKDKTQGNNQSSPKTAQEDTKAIVDDLSKTLGNDKLLEAAKDNGITWTENANKGINIMRAKMALKSALSNDPSLADKLKQPKASDIQKDLDDTKKQVAELTDMLGKLRNPTAKQVQSNQQKVAILKGIDTGSKSKYEQKNFGDVLDNASPEDLRNYRTLGMCAGDKESAEYLSDLYRKYSKAMGATSSQTIVRDGAGGVWNDPIRNKLQGTVNSSVVSVVKSSVRNARKMAQSQGEICGMLESHWKNPSSFSDVEIDDIKANSKTSLELGTNRVHAAEKHEGGEYILMKQTLDKMSMHPDYKNTAHEYKKLVEKFEDGTGMSPLVQSYIRRLEKEKDPENFLDSTLKHRLSEIPSRIEHYQKFVDDENEEIDQLNDALNSDDSGLTQTLKDRIQNEMKYNGGDRKKAINNLISHRKELKNKHQSVVDSYKSDKQQIEDYMNHPEYPACIIDAIDAVREMADPKFTDVNVNLRHTQKIAGELTRQYFCTTKDFSAEYPVLSKDNIDTLETGDQDALTNLALHAGSFKPSLAKKGDINAAMKKSMAERQAFLDAYGGAQAIKDNPSYAEDNEIRCKVSKASPKKTKEITDKIAKDWDMNNHGSMKYKIKGVYEVSGLALDKEFQQIKNQHSKHKGYKVGGKDCSSDLFYHGTGSMATSLILGHSGEFKLVKAKVGRMLGDGIYLADKSSKSGQYIGDSGYSRKGIEGSLMIVEASLGQTATRRGDVKGVDSVFAGKGQGLLNSEWCVHNPKAVIPRYLVHMEIV